VALERLATLVGAPGANPALNLIKQNRRLEMRALVGGPEASLRAFQPAPMEATDSMMTATVTPRRGPCRTGWPEKLGIAALRTPSLAPAH